MANFIASAAFACAVVLVSTGVAQGQGSGATGGTAGSSGAGGNGTTSTGTSSALPSGGVPGAGSIGGVGTPPADVQGKPNLSTPGANTRP